jgi:hypothetical protein
MEETKVIRSVHPVLVLRTCKADMTSFAGFSWPRKGEVTCTDWKPSDQCGNGLHGILWGAGDSSLLDFSEHAVWLVVEIEEFVDLGGKVKFPRGNVVFAGSRAEATALIAASVPIGTLVIGATASAGDGGTASVGARGTASAGFYGTASAGFYGTASVGARGTASAGVGGTASAGDRGTIILRYYDPQSDRYRIHVAYPGENGIEPHALYRYSLEDGLIKA